MVQETTGSETTHEPPVVEEAAGSAAAATTDEERDRLASKVVDRFSLWSAAGGLIPLPFVDVAAVSSVQLLMLRRLSAIYGVPFSKNLGKSFIASLAGSVAPAGAAFGAASALKAVPALGVAVGMVTMTTIAAGATYIMGKVFIKHFQSGGTLLDFNPPDYREFIKAQQEKLSSESAPTPVVAQPAPSKRSASRKGAAATRA
ncbi:MAG: YcjF family protein [Hyphomicrobiales bacterium]